MSVGELVLKGKHPASRLGGDNSSEFGIKTRTTSAKYARFRFGEVRALIEKRDRSSGRALIHYSVCRWRRYRKGGVDPIAGNMLF